MAAELTTSLNFVFALIIVILGALAYRMKNMVLPLYIAFGFGLFAISHLAILLGTPSSDLSIIVIRTLGYLVIIFALFKEVINR